MQSADSELACFRECILKKITPVPSTNKNLCAWVDSGGTRPPKPGCPSSFQSSGKDEAPRYRLLEQLISTQLKIG
jgi:hypothetical protein